MQEVLSELQSWSERGDRIAIATVVGVSHSAPRAPGAKMLVSDRGEVAGSVSGGCVEGAVVEVAERVLDGVGAQLLRFGMSEDGLWSTGLPCGGEIEVFVEVFDPAVWAGSLERVAGRSVVVTVLEGPGAGAKAVIGADGALTSSLGSAELDAEARRIAPGLEESTRLGSCFFDLLVPEPRLIIFGAGDISVAVCRMAAALHWRPYVVDPRSRFATSERFPDAVDVIADWPDRAFARLGGLGAEDSIVVLTHDPKLDDAALELALASPVRFIGAMGSRRAHARRCERLSLLGVGESDLARISAPLGLDLGASGREETALSMLAEIVAARHGRSGGRLQDAPGRIHEIGMAHLKPA